MRLVVHLCFYQSTHECQPTAMPLLMPIIILSWNWKLVIDLQKLSERQPDSIRGPVCLSVRLSACLKLSQLGLGWAWKNWVTCGQKKFKDPKLLGDNIFWIKEKICGIKKLVKKDLAQKNFDQFFSIVYRSTSWGWAEKLFGQKSEKWIVCYYLDALWGLIEKTFRKNKVRYLLRLMREWFSTI